MGRLRNRNKSAQISPKRPYRQTEPRQGHTSINKLINRAASRISAKVASHKSLNSEAVLLYKNEVQNGLPSGSNVGSHLDSRYESNLWREDFDIGTANRLTALADIYYNSMPSYYGSRSARRRRNQRRRRNRRNFGRDDDFFPGPRRRCARPTRPRRIPRRNPERENDDEANLISSLYLVTSSLRGTLLTLRRIKNLMERRFDSIGDIFSTHNSPNASATRSDKSEKIDPNIKVKREIEIIEVKSSKSLLRCKQIKQEKNEREKIEQQQSKHQQPQEEPKFEDCIEN